MMQQIDGIQIKIKAAIEELAVETEHRCEEIEKQADQSVISLKMGFRRKLQMLPDKVKKMTYSEFVKGYGGKVSAVMEADAQVVSQDIENWVSNTPRLRSQTRALLAQQQQHHGKLKPSITPNSIKASLRSGITPLATITNTAQLLTPSTSKRGQASTQTLTGTAKLGKRTVKRKAGVTPNVSSSIQPPSKHATRAKRKAQVNESQDSSEVDTLPISNPANSTLDQSIQQFTGIDFTKKLTQDEQANAMLKLKELQEKVQLMMKQIQ